MSKRKPPPRHSTAQAARDFARLAKRFVDASRAGQYDMACQAAEAALRIQPRHMVVLADYAFALMRLKRFQEAHAIYLKVYEALGGQPDPGATWLDGLAEVCGWLNRPADVRRFGNESLELSDRRLGHAAVHPLPAQAPPRFDASNPDRNIISFTLFGDNPRYCESGIMNVGVASELFPGWRCRFYLDDSVPTDVRRRLAERGAQVVDMSGSASDGVHPLMWRFLAADDPEVARFLIRDADSLLSEREQVAVEEWLRSSYWFHHMRDYFTHTELILAGMWGGQHGALPELRPLMKDWLARQGDPTRFADQLFLREAVWPTLRQSVLSHDEIFGFHGARPFPVHPPIRWKLDDFHVGSNASFQGMQGASSKADDEMQGWVLRDESGATVCRYSSPVRDGRWSASLPFFMIQPIAAGQWRVVLSDSHA